MQTLKARIPWPVKIAAKIVLSRVPVGYSTWSRLELFKHGFMRDADYAARVFLQHFAQAPTALPPGYTCLELGPGDSLLSAIVARRYGAARVYLVDVGAFADQDVGMYREAASVLLDGSDVDCAPAAWTSVDDMLEDCHARYLTDGVASLATIEPGSVDFVWSQAVLEHVRRREFGALLYETRRVLRSGGFASHRVDLRDHLGGRLNNLRFSDQVWEGKLFSNSGFYTNRLRYSEIINFAEKAGFSIRSTRRDEWSEVPIERTAMAEQFRGFDDDDLRVKGFFLTLDAG